MECNMLFSNVILYRNKKAKSHSCRLRMNILSRDLDSLKIIFSKMLLISYIGRTMRLRFIVVRGQHVACSRVLCFKAPRTWTLSHSSFTRGTSLNFSLTIPSIQPHKFNTSPYFIMRQTKLLFNTSIISHDVYIDSEREKWRIQCISDSKDIIARIQAPRSMLQSLA